MALLPTSRPLRMLPPFSTNLLSFLVLLAFRLLLSFRFPPLLLLLLGVLPLLLLHPPPSLMLLLPWLQLSPLLCFLMIWLRVAQESERRRVLSPSP